MLKIKKQESFTSCPVWCEGYLQMKNGARIPFTWDSGISHDDYFLRGFKDEVLRLWRVKEDWEVTYQYNHKFNIFKKENYLMKNIEFVVYFFEDETHVDFLEDYKEV